MKKNTSTKFYQESALRTGPGLYACLLFLLSLIGATGTESRAQTSTLAAWDFRTKGGQTSVATTTTVSGVSTTAPSLVASLASGFTAVDYFANSLIGRNQTATTLAAAITGNDYISFTVTPASGRTLSVSSVKIRPVSQNRARSFTLMSSVRGFTAGNEISTFTSSATDGAPLTTISITGHGNLTGAVEFRLYVYGHTDTWEAVGIGNRAAALSEADLIVEGSVGGGTALRDPENPAATTSGLDYQYYEGTGWSVLPDFNALTAIKSGTAANFDLGVRNRDDNFGVSFTGFVNVPTDGTYTFYTSSDDGSKLFIGTTQVVDNDGLHATQERSGSIGLKAGRHAVRVVFFEAGGGEVLSVSYAGPGIAKQTIPATALSRAGGTDAWPRVGAGLDGLSWWAPYCPFVDAVKAMRWNNVGSWDANGYPASATGGTVSGWAGYDNGTTWPDGDYVLTWEGSGDVVVIQNAVLKSQSLTTNPKRRVYTINTGQHALMIQVNSFPATNIRLFLPGLENHTSLWNPDYVAYMEPFRGTVLRFMDLNGTNHSQQANWSDRTPRNWSTYVNSNDNSAPYTVKGNASYEAMLELSNQLDCDMWVTVPHLATDDYVQKLANLIKTGRDGTQQVTQPLKANKKVWIEYSNEVWNWSFTQAQWVNNNTSIPGANVYQKYANQAVRMFNTFRTAFADNSRVRRILSTQTDWGDAWVTREYFSVINPGTDIDAVGVTTYFSHGLEQWMYDNWPVTQAQAIDRLRTLVGTGPFTANETVWANQVVAKQFAIAAEFGNVPLVAYEGNSHVTTSAMIRDRSGAQRHLFDAIPESVNFLHQMERTTAFAGIYNNWIRRYEATGNGVFKTNMPFVLVSGWSKWGQWGHVEYVGQTVDQAPKYKMLLDHYNLPYPVIRSAGSPRAAAVQGDAAPGVGSSAVFPNPTNGVLYIKGVKEHAAVAVYNTFGQRVARGVGPVINMSKLAAGMYLVDVDGKRHKVIKN
ncbi:MAG: T9SS type A sorting domain-containing protein [Cytophagales bacterium]|nr:T9SS type A sorting domain-containing protein [Cytophagales bacterium]